MDELIKHFSAICSMDWQTLGVIAALCAVAAYALKDYMASPIFVVFAYPVLFIFSIFMQYLFILGDFYVTGKIDQWLMWTILASICGNIIGITLVAWFGRFREALTATQMRR